MTNELRRSVLCSLGATPGVVDELIAYNENVFECASEISEEMEDELFVSAWAQYVREAGDLGAYETLKKHLVQFCFPVRTGMSSTEAYRRATRKGERPPGGAIDGGLALEDPAGLHIAIHPTTAGRIPLLITTSRTDFITLVRALSRKNEPEPIPASMGACMVAGFNNWERISTYRHRWCRENPEAKAEGWNEEFRRLATRKELYQDRFIILGDGPYSAVRADELGLHEEAWRACALIIRREHECTHYYTRRVLGSMRNNLLDELIADYMGILDAIGQFRADWFLRFMGLEDFPQYRSGGRLENYVDGLSEDAVRVLRALLVCAASNLERCGPRYERVPAGVNEKARVLQTLTHLTLEEMALRTEGLAHFCSSKKLIPVANVA